MPKRHLNSGESGRLDVVPGRDQVGLGSQPSPRDQCIIGRLLVGGLSERLHEAVRKLDPSGSTYGYRPFLAPGLRYLIGRGAHNLVNDQLSPLPSDKEFVVHPLGVLPRNVVNALRELSDDEASHPVSIDGVTRQDGRQALLLSADQPSGDLFDRERRVFSPYSSGQNDRRGQPRIIAVGASEASSIELLRCMQRAVEQSPEPPTVGPVSVLQFRASQVRP